MKYGKGKSHKQNCTHFSMSKQSVKGSGGTVHPNSLSNTSVQGSGGTRPKGFSEVI